MTEQSKNTSTVGPERLSRARYRFLQVWTIVGALILVACAAYILGILSIPVGIIIWTAIIVFILRTPVNWLERQGIKRGLGTTLAYLLMLVVLAALVLILFSPVFGIGEQFRDLLESLPSYVSSLTDWYNAMYAQYAHVFQDDTVKSWTDQVVSSLGTWASNTARLSAEGIVTIGSSIVNACIVIGFALVVAFWILMELPDLGTECRRLIGPKWQEDAHMLHVTVTRIMGGYIKATLLQCFFIGFGCTIAYAIIGIPNYTALGAITGLLNIIPVVGPWLGGALAAIIGVFIEPWVAIVALLATIVIQQFVYTFISPKLMANNVDIHPALVFIALFSGSAIGGAMGGFLGGLVGMLASIPAVAAAKAIFVYYFEKRTGRRIIDEHGVFFQGMPSASELDLVDPIGDAASTMPTDEVIEESFVSKITSMFKKNDDSDSFKAEESSDDKPDHDHEENTEQGNESEK